MTSTKKISQFEPREKTIHELNPSGDMTLMQTSVKTSLVS